MFFGWHLLILIGGLVVVLLILGLMAGVLGGRRRGRGAADAKPVVSITLSLAALWAVFSVIGALVALLSTLFSPAVTLTVPVRSYWPLPLPGVSVDTGAARVTGGGFDSAELSIEGLSSTVRALWGTGTMLGILVPGAIAALIAVVCFQLLAGRAFAPVVARAAMATAAIVMLGGLGTQILCGIAGSMASAEALTMDNADITGYPDSFDLTSFLPQPAFTLTIDFWPIGAGLAFAALAAVFTYGARLQHDTDLLV